MPWTVAGNQAAATLFAQRQTVEPKARTYFPGKAGDFQAFIDKGGPYTMSMYALNDDIVGHAWIGVKRGDGQVKTIGFWPNAVYSGIVGPDTEITPDPHTGGQTSGYDEPFAEIAQMYRVLPVIHDWDGAIYSMLFKNCAHFVVETWTAVTGKDVMPGNNGDLMVDMWNPLMIGMAIDARNKQKKALDAARSGKLADTDTDTDNGFGFTAA